MLIENQCTFQPNTTKSNNNDIGLSASGSKGKGKSKSPQNRRENFFGND